MVEGMQWATGLHRHEMEYLKHHTLSNDARKSSHPHPHNANAHSLKKSEDNKEKMVFTNHERKEHNEKIKFQAQF
jgi:hypothetical protein